MKRRCFPDFIDACVEALGKDTPVPDNFAEWTALCAIAGALGRRVWLDRGTFILYPNLYVALVAPPGFGKSISLNLPFRKIYQRLTTDIGTKENDSNFNPGVAEYGLTEYPLYLLDANITHPRLMQLLEKAHRIHMPLSRGNDLFHESPLMFMTSEFGNFMNKDDKSMHTCLTDMWDGTDPIHYWTKNMGDNTIRGVSFNWLSCVTPSEFVNNMPANAKDQGLLSRIIVVKGSGTKPRELLINESANYNKATDLACDLGQIANMSGPFTIDNDTAIAIQKDIDEGITPVPNDPILTEYCARRISHLLKVTMSMAASKSNNTIITLEAWQRAKKLLLSAESDMPEVLRHFGMSRTGMIAIDLQQVLNKIVTTTKGVDGIPITKFRREILKRVSTPGEVEQTLKAMVEAGMIRQDGDAIYPSNSLHVQSQVA